MNLVSNPGRIEEDCEASLAFWGMEPHIFDETQGEAALAEWLYDMDILFTLYHVGEYFQCPSHISQSAAPAFHSIASEIAGRILTYSIDCPSHISQSAAPAFHSIASEIAGRILTYSIDATKGLCCRRSRTYLSRYVLRSAASPLVTAAGFLLLVEGHR
ncbi:hypothetical protein TIFTF001_029158 [Ficus carica]|uniref:Uncharacterized protein n=1 Tax=Ficus carica TaxID=3494 RepID=A0AA88DRA9_FICCA|nr:hypothetical protein TIFTF001_029158 [Ficus carica]